MLPQSDSKGMHMGVTFFGNSTQWHFPVMTVGKLTLISRCSSLALAPPAMIFVSSPTASVTSALISVGRSWSNTAVAFSAASRLKLTNRFWSHSMTPGLSHAAQAVWCYLWSLADGRGRCYPSQLRIAERVGCSRRYTRQLIRELRGRGYLAVVSRGTNKGRNRANLYRIRLPKEPTDEEL